MDANVEKAIADQWAGFRNALMNQDVGKWLSFWTPDARVMEPGMDVKGSALFDAGTEFFESGGKVYTFEMESFEIFVHGDVAYQIGQYDESFHLGTGEAVEVHNFVTVRWVKEGDGMWRMSRFVAGPRKAPEEV